MDAINAVAKRHGLYVVEDAAQAIGARYKDRPVGGLGDIAGFSLHPLKNLHVYGDGGLITTDNEDFYVRMKELRNHGLKNRDTCGEWGLNSRLDTLQAAIASYKLDRLDGWTEEFRAVADQYREGLSDVVTVPRDTVDEYAVYHNFVIYTDRRDALMAFLTAKGIDTKIHYPVLLHLQPAARDLGYRMGDFPVAEKLAGQMMSLPIFPELTQVEIDSVIAGIRAFFTGN
jgi:dTDP-4-amino-4,6-dideoxygalactose transaminase